MSADVEQVMAQCSRGCFTGLLRVRTREGDGEVRFLSGIQDGIRFDSVEGDAALERLMAATEPEFEAISSLPPIGGSSSSPLPPEGRLETFHAAQLMRYCESNSLTCALELEVEGRVLTARYRLGELLSVEPDSEHTARLAEAKSGLYRFRLPRFELPAGVQQRRSAPAPAAASAPPAPPARSAPPAAAPAAAKPVAPKPSVPFSPPKKAPEQRPLVEARPAAARVPAQPGPAPLVGMPSVAIGSSRPAAGSSAAARPAAASAPASPAFPAGARPASPGPRAPAPEGRPAAARPVEAAPHARAEAPRAAPASLQGAAPASPRGEAGAVAPAKPALEGLWADAVKPPPQSAPLELDTASPNVLGPGSLPGASGRPGGLSSLAYKPPGAPAASPAPARSSGRLWLLLVLLVIVALVVVGWLQLGL